MKKILLSMVVSLVAISASASGWEGLVQKLTQTRAELETLSKESESIQKEKQTDLDQWLSRKSELDGQLQKEKMRQMQIAEKLKKLEMRVKSQDKADPQAQKTLLGWIDGFEGFVKESIPFRHEQRLEALKILKQRAHKKHESLEFVLADLWAFIETELKMAQTNEYRIMDLAVNGETKKCEVARLGLQSLFAVTPEGKVLLAQKNGGTWTWTDMGSSPEQESVLSLVKNLKNKNDSGYYQLPFDQKQMGASL